MTVKKNILKMNQVVIPQNLKMNILEMIHTGHLGAKKREGKIHWWGKLYDNLAVPCSGPLSNHFELGRNT